MLQTSSASGEAVRASQQPSIGGGVSSSLSPFSAPVLRRAQTACLSSMRVTAQQNNNNREINNNSNCDAPAAEDRSQCSKVPHLPPIANAQSNTASQAPAGGIRAASSCGLGSLSNNAGTGRLSPTGRCRKSLPAGDLGIDAAQYSQLEHAFPLPAMVRTDSVLTMRRSAGIGGGLFSTRSQFGGGGACSAIGNSYHLKPLASASPTSSPQQHSAHPPTPSVSTPQQQQRTSPSLPSTMGHYAHPSPPLSARPPNATLSHPSPQGDASATAVPSGYQISFTPITHNGAASAPPTASETAGSSAVSSAVEHHRKAALPGSTSHTPGGTCEQPPLGLAQGLYLSSGIYPKVGVNNFGPYNDSNNALDTLGTHTYGTGSGTSSSSSSSASSRSNSRSKQRGQLLRGKGGGFQQHFTNTNDSHMMAGHSISPTHAEKKSLPGPAFGDFRAFGPQSHMTTATTANSSKVDDDSTNFVDTTYGSASSSSGSSRSSSSSSKQGGAKGSLLKKNVGGGALLRKGNLSSNANTHSLQKGGQLNATALEGVSGNHEMARSNHSTRSLTAIANGIGPVCGGAGAGGSFLMGSPFGKMVVAEEGNSFLYDSISPVHNRGRSGGGAHMAASNLFGSRRLGGAMESSLSPSPMAHKERRMSLLPPGGKKEIKKISQLTRDIDPLEEMLDEVEKAATNGICDFNMLELTAYPSEILTPDITSVLKVLILSSNSISSLPEEAFRHMKNLQKLDLAENKLTTIPASLLFLPSLEILLLDHNQIVSIPFQKAFAMAKGELDGGSGGERRESFLGRTHSFTCVNSHESSLHLPSQGVGYLSVSSNSPTFAATVGGGNSNGAGGSPTPVPTPPPPTNSGGTPTGHGGIRGSFGRSGSAMGDTVTKTMSMSGMGGGFRPTFLPKIKKIGLAYNDLKLFPTEFLHQAGASLGELVLSSNPDLFTTSQPSLVDFERCRVNNKDYKLTLAVDNRPRFALVLEREGWASRLPWLTVEWEKIYPDKVLDFLFLGSLRTAQTPQVYEDLNIGFILTAGRDLEVHVSPGMKQLEIAVDDLPGENMIPLFEQCFAFIDEAKRARKGVLIHCFAGLSRSVTITAAYLMRTMYPMTRDEAMVLIRQSRKAAMPNRGFMENLKIYERQLREQHGDPPLTPK